MFACGHALGGNLLGFTPVASVDEALRNVVKSSPYHNFSSFVPYVRDTCCSGIHGL